MLQDLEDCQGRAVADTFAQHLQNRGCEYYHETGPVRTQLVRHQKCQKSTFYEFRVTTKIADYDVLIKVPFGLIEIRKHLDTEQKHVPAPPRLFPKSAPHTKGPREYAALSRIHDHFAGLQDPRFGTIRILDFLLPQGALVMEKGRDPLLRRVFINVNRVCYFFTAKRLERAFRNAGMWLQTYHPLTDFDHTAARSATQQDFFDVIERFSDYLLADGRYVSLLRVLSARLRTAARLTLPDHLPLGLGHGD